MTPIPTSTTAFLRRDAFELGRPECGGCISDIRPQGLNRNGVARFVWRNEASAAPIVYQLAPGHRHYISFTRACSLCPHSPSACATFAFDFRLCRHELRVSCRTKNTTR